jgi:hypothetical protein
MTATTDATHAVEFLRWLFSDEPHGYIFIRRSRPDPAADPKEEKIKNDLAQFTCPRKWILHGGLPKAISGAWNLAWAR